MNGWLVPILQNLGMGGGAVVVIPEAADPGGVFRRADADRDLRRGDTARVFRRTDADRDFRRPE